MRLEEERESGKVTPWRGREAVRRMNGDERMEGSWKGDGVTR